MKDNVFPLSLSQNNILDQERKFTNSPINNICTTLNIRGRIDFRILEDTLNLILEKDDTLRTRFVYDTEINQYIYPYQHHRFPVFDFMLTNQEGIDRWTDSISKEPMPLYDAPMYRFYFYKTEEMQGGVLIKTHHLISDGYTQVLLCNRIAEIYLQKLADEPVDFTVKSDYRSHIAKEELYLNSKNHEKDLTFWEKVTDDLPDAISMKDFTSAAATYIGNRVTFCLSEKQNHLISQYCEENRISPFSLFYMALAIWLKRARDVDRFTIGVPILNRNDFEEKNSSGMFVSTLPFVSRIDADWNINTFNDQLMEDWLQLLRHQRFPYPEIYRLAKQKNPEIGELFHLVLSYQNSLAYQTDNTQVVFDGRWNYSGYQVQHLCIHISNRQDIRQYTVDYDYLVQVFHEAEIVKFHHMLMNIIEDALLHQDKPIWALRILNDETENNVLYHYSSVKSGPLKTEPLKAAFYRLRDKQADKIALIYQGQRLSYRSLIDKAIVLADQYRRDHHQETIALLIGRKPELLIALLSIVYSDNTWLIIDEKLPPERIRAIINDAQVKMVISDHEFASLPEGVSLWRYQDPNADTVERPVLTAADGRIAYLVYTSGSTGAPKGVRIKETALLNFAKGCSTLYGHGAVLSICNTGFDAFMLETVVSLLNHQTIVLAEDNKVNNPHYLVSLFNAHDIGFMALTPSRLNAYMQDQEFAKALCRIETIVCGGEVFPAELLMKVKRFSSARVINQYGPSEATVGVCYKDLSQARFISVGRPMTGCRLYVLDDHRLPLPIGSIGEVYIGGVCLADGYQNRPQETEECFIINPFEPQEKLYRTRDSGYWNNEGDLVIVGRKDDQIKLHGYRIELSEIQSRLAAYPDIMRAAAVALPYKGRTAIAAYYESLNEITELKLREYLSAYLPYYMIPTFMRRVDQITLTVNGKIDLTGLPLPTEPSDQEEPHNALEAALLKLFRINLKQDDLGINSDYFLSGGDSLSAIELLADIEEQYHVQITILELYTLRTAQALAIRIRQENGITAEAAAPATPLDHYPLTMIQRNIYVLQHLNNDVSYNMPGIIRFFDRIDIQHMEQAFNTVIAKEPVLRSAFSIENNELTARVVPCRLKITISAAERLTEAIAAFVQPFDLSQAPLMRAAVYHDESNDILLIDMHHIIMDGISTPLLLDRFRKAYLEGSFTPSAHQYPEYAWQQAATADTMLEQQRTYWKQRFTIVPEPFMVNYNQRPENQDEGAGRASFAISNDLADKLAVVAKTKQLTPFMLMLAAFALMLHKLSRQQAICIGTVTAGRNHPHTQDMLGVFINTLPTIFSFTKETTLDQLLDHSRQQILGILANQDISQEDIIRELHLDREANGHGLYNVLFSMRPFVQAAIELDGHELNLEPIPNPRLKMDLALEICPRQDGFDMRFEYDRRYFDEALIAFYGRMYQTILNALCVDDLHQFCEMISGLPLDDRAELIDRPNYQRTPYDSRAIDQLIALQARQKPDKAAIIFHDHQLSFRELDTKAEQLAGHLILSGVTNGSRIAIAVDRGFELLTAMLAIMKAGGVYVPLDMTFPDERLTYMLSDSGCMLIVTQRKYQHRFANHELLFIDELPPLTEPIELNASRDDMYILYTSGSTGKPKGVLLPHMALANLFSAMGFIYDVQQRPVLCATNPVFDIFISESLFALASGNTVIMTDEDEMLQPLRLAAMIEKYHVGLVQFTPSRCAFNLNEPAFSAALAQVDRLILIGEVLPESLLRRLQQTGPVKILNFYGPTEAAVYISYADLTKSNTVTIGKPLANCRIYVLDENQQLLPPTVAGQLYLAGVCLARGYVNKPEQTAAAFVNDPYFPGERMYQSGDCGYLDLNGDFVYLSRVDAQIKLNGHRIELREIDAVILNNSLASQALTVPIRIDGIISHLAAYVVSDLSKDAIFAALKEHLPTYMIPSVINKVDKMPLNANGKIDAKQLTAAKSEPVAKITNSVNADERAVMAEIWKATIKTDQIDPQRSFFEQGGTSLSALIVLSTYYKHGWSLTMKDFYDHPTLDQQYAYISGQQQPAPVPTGGYRRFVPQGRSNQRGTQHIMLTGATGYLGAYILFYLCLNKATTIYCLVRDADKLKQNLRYYFHDEWYEHNRRQIIPVKGDIAQPDLGLAPATYRYLSANVEQIIHAAAAVDHYAADDHIMKTNLNGTENMLQLATKSSAFFHYISTVGITGDRLLDPDNSLTNFDETMFDVGQNWMENLYTKSKFQAEAAVYAAGDAGLGVHVYRVGHLVGRRSDGRFQINPDKNEIYRIMLGLQELHAIPAAMADLQLEMTPVDECAAAVVKLLNADIVTYHVYNPHRIPLRRCLPLLNLIDETQLRSSAVSGSHIPDVIAAANRLKTIGHQLTITSTITEEILKQNGFVWSIPDIDRLLK